MTILTDKFSKTLVPNHQLHFDKDINSILGFAYLKNTTEATKDFNSEIAKEDESFSIKPPKNDLKLSDADKWTCPSKEEGLQSKPSGAYIVSTEPCNTVLYAGKRSGACVRYLNPLIDLWSRQYTQPNIIYIGSFRKASEYSHNKKLLNKLKMRGYQINSNQVNCDNPVNSICSLQFVDFMPILYGYFYEGNVQECFNLLYIVASGILKKHDELMVSALNSMLQFATILYFKHLKECKINNLEHAGLKDFYEFIKKLSQTYLSADEWNKLDKRFKISDLIANNEANSLKSYSLLYLLFLIESASSDSTLFGNRNSFDLYKDILNKLHAISGSAKMFNLISTTLIDDWDSLITEINSYTQKTFKPDVISNTLGLTIDVFVGKDENGKIAKLSSPMFDITKHKYEASVDQWGWVRLTCGKNIKNVDEFLKNDLLLSIKSLDGQIESTEKLVIKNNPNVIVHRYNQPWFVIAPIAKSMFPQLSQYNLQIEDLFYNIIVNTSMLGYFDQQPVHSTKYLVDLRQEFDKGDLHNIDLKLASGLGQRQNHTLIFEDNIQCKTLFPDQDVLLANVLYFITLKNQHIKAMSDKQLYEEYSYLPLFDDFDRLIKSYFDLSPDKQLAKLKANLSKELHNNDTKSRLAKLENALIMQIKDN